MDVELPATLNLREKGLKNKNRDYKQSSLRPMRSPEKINGKSLNNRVQYSYALQFYPNDSPIINLSLCAYNQSSVASLDVNGN